jgi:fructose-bisphosphate aldolase, class II
MAHIALRQLLDHAAEHDYGVPALNINNMEQGLAIMVAAAATDALVCWLARIFDLDLADSGRMK